MLTDRILTSLATAAFALVVATPALAQDAQEMAMDDQPDIVETAVSAGSFNTLAAALEAANLIETLQGDGPFTVFAPTDEAFAKLPAGTVESLLEPGNRDQLVAILTYHVVPGELMAADVIAAGEAKTVQGGTVEFSVTDAGAMIQNANIVQTDIAASNGVIHVIDTVIMPEKN
ncbi:MAG TPA: fasciclin domain-containing protein [Woeseiaceae bacterium]|nr:fasciclin domain-containing protein [Woeseiaceae bacterium]